MEYSRSLHIFPIEVLAGKDRADSAQMKKPALSALFNQDNGCRGLGARQGHHPCVVNAFGADSLAQELAKAVVPDSRCDTHRHPQARQCKCSVYGIAARTQRHVLQALAGARWWERINRTRQ